jgi:hypothetical protein
MTRAGTPVAAIAEHMAYLRKNKGINFTSAGAYNVPYLKNHYLLSER